MPPGKKRESWLVSFPSFFPLPTLFSHVLLSQPRCVVLYERSHTVYHRIPLPSLSHFSPPPPFLCHASPAMPYAISHNLRPSPSLPIYTEHTAGEKGKGETKGEETGMPCIVSFHIFWRLSFFFAVSGVLYFFVAIKDIGLVHDFLCPIQQKEGSVF